MKVSCLEGLGSPNSFETQKKGYLLMPRLEVNGACTRSFLIALIYHAHGGIKHFHNGYNAVALYSINS